MLVYHGAIVGGQNNGGIDVSEKGHLVAGSEQWNMCDDMDGFCFGVDNIRCGE